jgi:hypothetical protein
MTKWTFCDTERAIGRLIPVILGRNFSTVIPDTINNDLPEYPPTGAEASTNNDPFG